MPRASKAILSKEELNNLFSDFIFILSSFKKSGDLHNFLDEFLTKEEKVMLSKRIAIFSMLYSNKSLRQTQQTLGMSDESIRIYNLKKHQKSEKFKQRLLKLATKHNSKKLLSTIEKN